MGTINAVIDLSHNNPHPDWVRLKVAGVLGVIHKASQGHKFEDSKYIPRRAMAKAAGIELWGAYHFGTGFDGRMQADHFLKQAEPDGETLLALDLEQNPQGDSMTLSQAYAFILRVEAVTGRYPVLYAGGYLREQLKGNPDAVLMNCPLWIAEYNNHDQPDLLPGWDTWSLWQYTDGSHDSHPDAIGTVIACDRSRFNGSAEELKTFWTRR